MGYKLIVEKFHKVSSNSVLTLSPQMSQKHGSGARHGRPDSTDSEAGGFGYFHIVRWGNTMQCWVVSRSILYDMWWLVMLVSWTGCVLEAAVVVMTSWWWCTGTTAWTRPPGAGEASVWWTGPAEPWTWRAPAGAQATRRPLSLSRMRRRPGARVLAYTHHGEANQLWRQEGGQGGQLVGCDSGLALDIGDGDTRPGAGIIIWHRGHDKPNQMWRFEYLDWNIHVSSIPEYFIS